MHVCLHVRVHVCPTVQSCLTLCDPMDYSPPHSSVHGAFQARILEWVATSYFRGTSQTRDPTPDSSVSCIAGRFFTTEPPGKPPDYKVFILINLVDYTADLIHKYCPGTEIKWLSTGVRIAPFYNAYFANIQWRVPMASEYKPCTGRDLMYLVEGETLLVLLYKIGFRKACPQTKKISIFKTKPEDCPFSLLST